MKGYLMLSIISHLFGTLIFFMTIAVCLVIARSSSAKSGSSKEKQKFWSRESEANSVRRKDISNLDYILIPADDLPLDTLSAKTRDTLISLSGEKILNLSAYSNTDLKMMYGPANLDELSHCDDNFTLLIRTLHKAGAELAESPETEDTAIKFLEYSVSIGSDMSSTFELLGQLYLKYGRTDAFDSLYESADKLNSISKPVIMSKLNSIKTD
jgi:hypothetical protein